MTFRKAKISDIGLIVPMFVSFIETNMKSMIINFDIDVATQAMINLIHLHLVVVMEIDGKVFGGIGGLIITPSTSSEKIFQELFFYVHPDHRDKTLLLLKATEGICKQHEVKRIVIGSFGESKALDRWYRMKGYRLLETHFTKEV